MRYFVKENVDLKELEKFGFKPYLDEEKITSYFRKSKVIDNDVMVATEYNCAYIDHQIEMRFDNYPLHFDDIQDLIDAGLVEVRE